jgi:hypothetical protein
MTFLSTHTARLVAALLVAVILMVGLGPAPEAQAATTYRVGAAWYRTNLLQEHGNYGVFIVPSGHANPRLYLLKDNSSGWFLGDRQCGAINAVVGPGYINDPGGKNSAYVPRGYIGMGICASTRTLIERRLAGVDINQGWRWVLTYER